MATPTPVVPDSAVTGAGRGDWLTRNPVTPRSDDEQHRLDPDGAGDGRGGGLAVAEAGRALDGGQGAPAVPAAERRDQQRDRDLGEQQPAVAGLHQAGPRADDAPGEEGAGGGDRQQQPAGEGREAGERGGREDLASGERPQRHHQPDETAEPRRTGHAGGGRRPRPAGARGRRRGCARPGTVRRAPARRRRPAASRASGPGGAVEHDQAATPSPTSTSSGAQQLVADQAGVERRHDVRELEALAVDRRDRDLQDDAGGARPGGVPQQPAQPGTRLGAGPGAGEDEGEEERQTRREQQPDVGDDRDDVADHGHRGRRALRLGRRRHRRARVRRPRRSARPRSGGRRRRARSTTRRRCRRRGRPRR